MPPYLALLLWLILLVALFRLDSAKDKECSLALWVPLAWMFFLGSRLPAQWLEIGGAATRAKAYEEGNPVDRAILFTLILMAVVILSKRSFRWGSFLHLNMALTVFLTFALISVLWSDYTLVSFKRWIRDLGNYLMALVVLSDPRPVEAVGTVLRRLSYLTIPLSIVLIKYYPSLGKGYSVWTGAAYFQGVGTTKNMLGVMCLVSGLYFFWDTLTRLGEQKSRNKARVILLNAAFIAMTLWLMNLADSATSTLCLALGCGVLAAAHSKLFRRHPTRLKVLIPSAVILYLVLEVGFDISNAIIRAVGRDTTLTTRTDLWSLLLDMKTHPVFGTGYESFWLGPRLQYVWANFADVNQAHNGYLEVYLNLGFMGLLLLVGFLMASYKNVCKKLNSASGLASLSLALWTVLLFYNVTEAAFKGQLMWATFLLVALASPVRTGESLEGRGIVVSAAESAKSNPQVSSGEESIIASGRPRMRR